MGHLGHRTMLTQAMTSFLEDRSSLHSLPKMNYRINPNQRPALINAPASFRKSMLLCMSLNDKALSDMGFTLKERFCSKRSKFFP